MFHGFAFSPDGKWIAATSYYMNHIWLWKVATGWQERLVDNKMWAWQVAWSPDGTQLACAGEIRSCRRPARLDQPVELDGTFVRSWKAADNKAGGGMQIRWTPNGTWLVLLPSTGMLTRVSIWSPEGRAGPVLDHPAPLANIALSSDGRRVATIEGWNYSVVRFWDTESGTLQETIRAEADHPLSRLVSGWPAFGRDRRFRSRFPLGSRKRLGTVSL